MFIKVSNPEQAKILSEKLYALSRPNRNPEDITTSLVSWRTHPVTGETVLEIPDGLILPVALSSDSKILAELLQPFVEIDRITLIDVKQIETKLTTSKVKNVLLEDILPAFLFEKQLTLEKLKEDGWFGEDVIKPSLKN